MIHNARRWRLSFPWLVGISCFVPISQGWANGLEMEAPTTNSASASVNAFITADQILLFADHLFSMQDYYRAITEYERFACLYPNDPRVPDTQLRVAECYLLGKKSEAALQRLSILATNPVNIVLADKAERLLADTYYWSGQYTMATTRYRIYLQEHPYEPWDSPIRLRLSLACMQFGNIDWAREAIRGEGNSSYSNRICEVNGFSALPKKSPLLAGTLSAVLPGAGQLYNENPSDALSAFVINGIVIAGAIVAFDKDEPVAGAMLSCFGLIWYSGNIYNAFNGSHRYNQRLQKSYILDLELKWGLTIDSYRDVVPVFGVSGHF